MKQLLRHVLQPVIERNMAGGSCLVRKLGPACWQCQSRAISQLSGSFGPYKQRLHPISRVQQRDVRRFSAAYSPLRREPRLPGEDELPRQINSSQPDNSTSKSDDAPIETPVVNRVPDEHLPSHHENQRWTLSKRLNHFMEEALAKLAIVSHKVNTYTGTDYSGIELLRKEIQEQEALVKARSKLVNKAKETYDAAYAQQASSQKEVVALLERKNSWNAQDLERYMSLIRSEHLNDQAVQAAKDKRLEAERALEEARTRLEQRERAQYHEEQIWSDTIRRNSTWVTIALMGVNIGLLLVSLVILEPWRRNRLVREIRSAFEENKTAVLVPMAGILSATDEAKTVPEIDDPSPTALKALVNTPPFPSTDVEIVQDPADEQTITAVEATTIPVILDTEPATIYEEPPLSLSGRARKLWSAFRLQMGNPLGDQILELRRVEVTAVAFTSAALGGVFIGLCVSLLR